MFRRHFLNLYHRMSVMTSATVKSSLHNGSFSFPEDIAFPMYLLSKTADFEHQTALVSNS